MKLAVITDSSVYLPQDFVQREDLFILDIDITIDGKTYIEGKNLSLDEFYTKMAASTIPPTNCATKYPIKSVALNFFDKNNPSETAGLM